MKLVVAAAVLTLGSAATAKTEEPIRIPTKAEMKRCPKLAEIDWKRVRKAVMRENKAPAGTSHDPLAQHREIRGPHPLPDLSRAEIAFDISIGPGKTQEYPTSTSSFVWREAGGEWQLNRVDHVSYPPEPLPPGSGVVMDAAWNALMQRPLREGPLEQSRAAGLDRILKDPCFLAQPDYVPFDAPARKGGAQPCRSAISSTVRIQAGSRVRFLSDPCGHGYGFDLARIVMYGDLDSTTYARRAVARALERQDFELRDLTAGKSGTWAEQVLCGTAAVGGVPERKFTWRRYTGGPYARERVTLEGQKDDFDRTFEAHWKEYCGR